MENLYESIFGGRDSITQASNASAKEYLFRGLDEAFEKFKKIFMEKPWANEFEWTPAPGNVLDTYYGKNAGSLKLQPDTVHKGLFVMINSQRELGKYPKALVYRILLTKSRMSRKDIITKMSIFIKIFKEHPDLFKIIGKNYKTDTPINPGPDVPEDLDWIEFKKIWVKK